MDDFNAPAQAEQPVIVETTANDPPMPPDPQAVQEPISRREAIEKALGQVDGQPRGPDGKFTQKGAPEASTTEVRQEEPKTPISEAPARFSADAKAAWAAAPEAIRGEINRAISELEGGLRQKDELLAPLKPYFDMAKSHGTSVDVALGNYVRMEQLLAKDMKAGLSALAQNFGMTLEQMVGQVTGQPAQPESAKDQHISRLEARLAQLEGGFQQSKHDMTMRDVQAFAAERPRFDELAPEIARLLQTGYAADLPQAYELAERLNPAPQPAAPAAPAPAPQPRPVRSVTGAPGSGSNPAARAPSSSPREAAANALRQVGL